MGCSENSIRRSARTSALMALAGLLALLVWCALAPRVAFADIPTEKLETVNVDMSASGAVEKVELECTLKNESRAAELEDRSELDAIQSDDGVTFTSSNGNLSWMAQGKNVTYTGTTAKALPVSIAVSYTLDGRPVSANELAGKSGEVKIRYDYANHDVTQAYVNGALEDIRTPFTCITALMVDGEKFTGVSVKNGKVIEDGTNVIIAGYAMPGLKQSLGPLAENADVPDYFEVTAQAKDFSLKPAMTIVTAGLMSDLDVDSLGIGDTADASSSLNEAMAQLISGSDELSSGMHDLADGAGELDAGAYELAEGARELSYGIYQLAYGAGGVAGLADLEDASAELVGALEETNAALGKLADAKKGLPAAASSLEAIAQACPDAATIAALEKAITASDLDLSVQQALIVMLEATPAVGKLSSAVTQCSDGLGELSVGFGELVDEAGNLPDGVAAAVSAAKGLYAGSSALADGADQLASGASELSEGMQQAADGAGELTEGLGTFEREGLAKIVDTIDNDIGGFKKRLSALTSASGTYDNFSGKVPGTKSSVQFVFESKGI